MEVTIPRRLLWAAFFLLVLAAGIGGLVWYNRHMVTEPPQAQAVREGIKAFYTMHIQSPKDWDKWAAQVCKVSTTKGCNITAELFAPALQKKFGNRTFTLTVAEVKEPTLVKDKGQTQIWKAKVTLEGDTDVLSEPLSEVYVEIAQENGTWKFQRVLTRQEVQALEGES